MKGLKFIVLTLVVSMAVYSQQTGDTKTSNRETFFEVKQSVFSSNGNLIEYTITEWNRPYTEIVKQTRYSATGSIIEQIEYLYYENGLISLKIIRESDRRVKNRFTYQYNQQGYLVRESISDNRSIVICIYEYTYDDKGKLLNRKNKNRTGSLEEEIKYIYDSSGNLAKQEILNKDGKLVSNVNFIWQNGLEMRNEIIINGNVQVRTINEYDKNKKLVKQTIENITDNAKQIIEYEYIFFPIRR
jgi:hypothetical protein